MIEILYNPWVYGIGTVVIGGLIVYFLTKSNKEDKNKNKSKRVGILNKGKENSFIDNSFEGFDVGIQDEGENTTAERNKFK